MASSVLDASSIPVWPLLDDIDSVLVFDHRSTKLCRVGRPFLMTKADVVSMSQTDDVLLSLRRVASRFYCTLISIPLLRLRHRVSSIRETGNELSSPRGSRPAPEVYLVVPWRGIFGLHSKVLEDSLKQVTVNCELTRLYASTSSVSHTVRPNWTISMFSWSILANS
jgi:hypothetical protein